MGLSKVGFSSTFSLKLYASLFLNPSFVSSSFQLQNDQIYDTRQRKYWRRIFSQIFLSLGNEHTDCNTARCVWETSLRVSSLKIVYFMLSLVWTRSFWSIFFQEILTFFLTWFWVYRNIYTRKLWYLPLPFFSVKKSNWPVEIFRIVASVLIVRR